PMVLSSTIRMGQNSPALSTGRIEGYEQERELALSVPLAQATGEDRTERPGSPRDDATRGPAYRRQAALRQAAAGVAQDAAAGYQRGWNRRVAADHAGAVWEIARQLAGAGLAVECGWQFGWAELPPRGWCTQLIDLAPPRFQAQACVHRDPVRFGATTGQHPR